jgi:molybdopterin molybdotransferase
MKMRPFGPLWSVEAALEAVLQVTRPVTGTERVPLDAGLGRLAARTVRATLAVPSFPRATWDGYAVRSSDTRPARSGRPIRLRVVGEIFAEDTLGRPVGPGEAVAIATGGCLPAGADGVVIFEDVEVEEDQVVLTRPVLPGRRVAAVGDDFARGAVVVRAGQPLTPAALGGLAAVGQATVEVRRRPIVAIVPNGNELVAPGRPLRRGQVHESNNRTLSALVTASGGIPRPTRPVRDEVALIRRALERANRSSDLVLVTGGSSVGERDFLPTIFPELGRLLFHGIAVRPGKPTLAAVVRGRPMIGMPGHPTSCLANGFWLLLPVLRKLAGLPGPGWIEGQVRLAAPAGELTPGFTTVVPLKVEGGEATPTFHDYALLAPGSGTVRSGTVLRVRFLPPPLASFPTGAGHAVGKSGKS